MRTSFHVQSLANLPYPTVLVPLSVFFAIDGTKEITVTDEQRRVINRWFWRTAFSRRYSAGVLRNLKSDIDAMLALRDGKTSSLGDFSVHIDDQFFLENDFSMGNVNTKTHILLLAQKQPVSFVSGLPVSLAETLKRSNRAEFHHLMPKAFLKDNNNSSYSDSALANFCFLSRADNRTLGGVAPSSYRKKISANEQVVLERALVPETIFNDDYAAFLPDRASLLRQAAEALID
jgi:hypothetical protein